MHSWLALSKGSWKYPWTASRRANHKEPFLMSLKMTSGLGKGWTWALDELVQGHVVGHQSHAVRLAGLGDEVAAGEPLGGGVLVQRGEDALLHQVLDQLTSALFEMEGDWASLVAPLGLHLNVLLPLDRQRGTLHAHVGGEVVREDVGVGLP